MAAATIYHGGRFFDIDILGVALENLLRHQ
jgi:hypothetical protein